MYAEKRAEKNLRCGDKVKAETQAENVREERCSYQETIKEKGM